MLPDLRGLVLETWAARSQLFEAKRRGGDVLEPWQRLRRAMTSLFAHRAVFEGEEPGGGPTAEAQRGQDEGGARPVEKQATAKPWDGSDWDDLTPQIRRVLNYMGDRERAHIPDFAEAVWGGDDVSDRAINTALSRTNKILGKHTYPRSLERVRGEAVIRWV
jgi:hypothetical protein